MANKPMFIQYGKYTPSAQGIYGVHWESPLTTTKWIRTDDAAEFSNPVPSYKSGNTYTTGSSPFDNISPWKDMIKSERTGGTMVAIPKFYYKWTKDGIKNDLKVSMQAHDGFSVSPAHRDRGLGEKDIVYIGRYHCADTTLKSATNKVPQTNKTRAEFRTAIHNLGSNIYQWDYACLVTIWILYLVEFADTDSQSTIGGGGRVDTSSIMTMGYTDSMPYHTGTVASSISSSAYGGTQYRNIEGLWDNIADFIDGIVGYNPGNYQAWCAIPNITNYSDNYSDGIDIGSLPSSTANWGNFMFASDSRVNWLVYPLGGAYSLTSGIPDYISTGTTGVVLMTYGGYLNTDSNGLFSLSSSYQASMKYKNFGSRLYEL